MRTVLQGLRQTLTGPGHGRYVGPIIDEILAAPDEAAAPYLIGFLEADRQHKLQEAARASECRMQIKEKCEAAPDALSSLMASPDGLGNVMLGLISQIGDFSARDEVAETAGVLARRGSRLSHQKIHVFRAPG